MNKSTVNLRSFFLFCILMIFALVWNLFSAAEIYAQESAKLREEYLFKLGITYEMFSGKKDKLKKGQEMSMWYSEAGYTGIGMGGQTAIFMVYDMKSMKMLTLMEAQKMAMVMDIKKLIDQVSDKAGVNANDTPDGKITKTGKSEKILGYTCEQYKVSSDKSETLVWITNELGSGFGDYAKSMAMAMGGGKATKGKGFPDMQDVANGVMLKMESTDTSKGELTRIEATAVDKEGKKINTSGYKMINMAGR